MNMGLMAKTHICENDKYLKAMLNTETSSYNFNVK